PAGIAPRSSERSSRLDITSPPLLTSYFEPRTSNFELTCRPNGSAEGVPSVVAGALHPLRAWARVRRGARGRRGRRAGGDPPRPSVSEPRRRDAARPDRTGRRRRGRVPGGRPVA